MRYKVKLSYPTVIVVAEKEYVLFPEQEVELPDSEIVETYKALGYLEPIETKKTRKEVSNDAS